MQVKTELPLQLGRVVATPAALRAIEEHGVNVIALLGAHRRGDWLDTSAADKRENDKALKTGARVLTVYDRDGVRLWVLTEAATDACPACHGYGGECEPDKGSWQGGTHDFIKDGTHFRDDLEPQRLSTCVMLPEDY